VKATTDKTRQRAEKLQAKLDDAKQKVREKQKELAAKMRSVKDEANEKIARLEAQKATATTEAKTLLERRLADVRSEYQRRIERLEQALDRPTAAHATSKP
jgi:flagellar biosynthesis chaperone FliJ